MAAGSVHFTRGNHSSDSAMQVAVDPANLILTRRPVSRYRMHVTVNQSRRECCALGVDSDGRACGIEILRFADCGNLAVNGDHRVGIENRISDVATQQKSDVVDHEPSRSVACLLLRHSTPSAANL